MNVAYLLAGLLIGFVVGSILVFIGMYQTAKAASGDRGKKDEIVNELLRQRNRIDQQIADHLGGMAKSIALHAGPAKAGLSGNDPWGWLRSWLKHYDEQTGSNEGQKIHDWIVKQPMAGG